MSDNPSAPPPSYDELAAKNCEKYKDKNSDSKFIECETVKSEEVKYENSTEIVESEIDSKPNNSEMPLYLQLQTNPYAYSKMCMNAPCAPPLPMETHAIQSQPIIVQPLVIQGSGLIANPDGSYDFGPYPCRVLCPECHKTTQTQIKYKNSGFTHILAGLLCFLGCCCLAPVPYFIDSCKNSVHHCGECGKYLGTFVNGYSINRYHKYKKYPQSHSNDKSDAYNCNYYPRY